jgi:para-nitrobenzyl esterase
MGTRFFVRLSVLAMAGICAVVAGRPRAIYAERSIVTQQGPIVGIAASGEHEYLGIPYAAPPVGNLRWTPPQPPAPFQGTFQATKPGNECPQPNGAGGTAGSEDCLTLNVYVPDVEPPEHGFPVMVWIHGGGLSSGAGFLYDPTPIVQKGNVIVVTINYRLGVLGFFAHPALDAEGHLNGNYGLMDQQFALKWVRRNIAAFGGDPQRITIFGESAGGFSVLSHLASPTAAGLFQRAISESGAYTEFQDYFDPISVVPLATAETVGTPLFPPGTSIAASVGCNDQTADCLRTVPAATLVQANPNNIFPFVDGTVLTQTLDSAFKNGSFNRVPVINGTNHDEYRLFVAFQYGNSLTDAEYPNAVAGPLIGPATGASVASFLSSPIQAVLNEYPLSNYPPPPGYSVSAPLALGALGTDLLFVCTARNADLSLSRYARTYTYEFHDETAPSFFPPGALNFPLGDSHVIELEYLFDLSAFGITPTFNSDQHQLSDTMINYWTQFAKTGTPNSSDEGDDQQEGNNESGIPHWPSYNATAKFISLVSPTPKLESDSSFDADHKCSSFWNTF